MRKAAGVISSSKRIARIVGSAMIRQISNNDQINGSDSAQLSHQRTNNARQKNRTVRRRSGNPAISSGNGNSGARINLAVTIKDSGNARPSPTSIANARPKNNSDNSPTAGAVTMANGSVANSLSTSDGLKSIA